MDNIVKTNALLGLIGLVIKDGVIWLTDGNSLLFNNQVANNQLIQKITGLTEKYTDAEINSIVEKNKKIHDELKEADKKLYNIITSIKEHYASNADINANMNTILGEINELQFRIIIMKCNMHGQQLFIDFADAFAEKMHVVNQLTALQVEKIPVQLPVIAQLPIIAPPIVQSVVVPPIVVPFVNPDQYYIDFLVSIARKLNTIIGSDAIGASGGIHKQINIQLQKSLAKYHDAVEKINGLLSKAENSLDNNARGVLANDNVNNLVRVIYTFVQKIQGKFDITYFVKNGVETNMKEFIISALGAVDVYIKLKVEKESTQDLIQIKDDIISLTTGEGAQQNYRTNCYNRVFPKTYNRDSNDASIGAATNRVLYEELKQKIELVLEGGSVVIFGSGYSGSGKTYTLFNGTANDKSILKQSLETFNSKNCTIELKIIEQYGKLTIETTDYNKFNIQPYLKTIFDKPSFEEKMYTYDFKTNDFKITDELDTIQFNPLPEDIVSLLSNLNRLRINAQRIKPTINNIESSRSHLYLIFKITHGGKTGHFTIIDMGGQENPRDILMDYMGAKDNAIIFKNYFELLFTYGEQDVDSHPEQFSRTNINTILHRIKKTEKNFTKELFFTESLLDPIKLFAKMRKTAVTNNYTVPITELQAKQYFLSLFKKNDSGVNDKANAIVNQFDAIKTNIKAFQTSLLTLYDEATIKKKYAYLGNDIKFTKMLIDTFLESFYINQTLYTKTQFLKKEQSIISEPGVYISPYNDTYDPFVGDSSGPDKNTMKIFNHLKGLAINQMIKFIEIGAIRADIPKKIDPKNPLYYKYALASCFTLRASAMLSGAQCTNEMNTICGKKGHHGGTNMYYHKYMKYKNKNTQYMIAS